MSVVIIGQNRWGHAETVAGAKKNWRAQGGQLSHGYTVIEFGADQEFAGVNMFGEVSWNGNTAEPTVTEVKPRATVM
ncbi:hypothetical protein [Mycolicibacterium sphagni]|uniref:hypothetical protein n=1 Tax=Mycolicibacterium sphagni TaxID=1786 RepID=UPI0021F3A83C|nr:hypothetical protein [Mycolicibacterium sphagni]MCV7174815.1 hypothetical protein [Mycolicibacterium sphagni]